MSDAGKAFIQPLCLTKEDSVTLEKETREQSLSDRWWQGMQFRLTASKFGEITRRNLKKSYDRFVQRMITRPEKSNHMPLSLKHGLQEELAAVKQYGEYMKRLDTQFMFMSLALK